MKWQTCGVVCMCPQGEGRNTDKVPLTAGAEWMCLCAKCLLCGAWLCVIKTQRTLWQERAQELK